MQWLKGGGVKEECCDMREEVGMDGRELQLGLFRQRGNSHAGWACHGDVPHPSNCWKTRTGFLAEERTLNLIWASFVVCLFEGKYTRLGKIKIYACKRSAQRLSFLMKIQRFFPSIFEKTIFERIAGFLFCFKYWLLRLVHKLCLGSHVTFCLTFLFFVAYTQHSLIQLYHCMLNVSHPGRNVLSR